MINKLEMEQSLYATLQLACCLIAIVVIAWLVMKYLTSKCSATDRESEAKRCHIHLCYLVGIGALLLIELVSFILTHTGGFSRIIFDQISLAATISSILLSVVAIIYSIVSGTNGANLYVKTEEVSKQIGETLPKLNALGETVKKLDATAQELKEVPSAVGERLKEIKAQMESMSELSQKMSQKLDNVACDILTMSEPLAGVFNEMHSKPDVHSDESNLKSNRQANTLDDVFRAYLRNGSLSGAFLLLACCYSVKKRKPIVLTEELFKDKFFRSDYLWGYLVASRALGIIQVEEIPPSMRIQIDSVYHGFDVEAEVLHLLNDAKTLSPKIEMRIEKCLKVINEYFDIEGK